MSAQTFEEESEKKHIHALIEHTPIAYIIMDDQYRIHYVNESFLKLRKLEKDKTIGEICYNISNAGTHCTYCAIEQALQSGEKALLQRKDVLPDGSVRYIDDYAVPLFRDTSTGRIYLLEIMVNRTEERIALMQYQSDVEEVINALVGLIEAKDSYTALHSKNVHRYAVHIARHMHLTEDEIFRISIAALLHDIGKVQIPLQVLNKPGKLDDDEFHVIQSHPVLACDMLVELQMLNDVCEMVRHHHERIDGRGYPDKMPTDRLSLGSRILAVADTYDAMTTDRPYRKALTHKTAMAELEHVSGSQLDKSIVRVFASIPIEELVQEVNCGSHTQCPLLVRNLKNDSLSDIQENLVVKLEDLENEIDSEQMRQAVFENTPCGYIILEQDNTLLYANEFFHQLISMDSNELYSYNKKFDLFVPQPEDEPHSGFTRIRRKVSSKDYTEYTLDVYAIDTSTRYQTYAVIDRTYEDQMTRQMDYELQQLLELLHEFLIKQEEDAQIDFCSPEELSYVKQKLESLDLRRRTRKN